MSDYQAGGYQAGGYQSSDAAKERVRQASDIVEVVSRYLPITSKGRHFVARCPWHDDTRPSFQVSQQRQTWRCWVCGIGGDVFSFVMKREGIEFREALELLAERANIELPKAKMGPAGTGNSAAGTPGAQDSQASKRELFEAMAWAEAAFFAYLRESPEARPAREYLRKRKITPATARQFRIGYAPNSWQWLTNQAQSPTTLKTLVESGTIGQSEKGRPFDRFKGRIIFPIHDAQGRTIGFGGRVLPSTGVDTGVDDSGVAKYINSPESRVFSKSEHVYALDLARDEIQRTKSVIVVEGYTDVTALHQAGITNAVAVLGTALGERHVRLLKRYADTIYLVLDGDEAGQKRTGEVLELFVSQQADLRVVQLPAGEDPADLVEEIGADGFRRLLASAVDAIEHKIRMATAAMHGIRDVHAANDALESILNALSKTPADAEPQVRLREHQVLARLAQQFQIEREALKARLASLRQAARRVNSKSQETGRQDTGQNQETGESAQIKPARAQEIDPWDLALLELLVLDPQSIDHVMDEIGPEELTSEPARAIYGIYRQRAQDGASCDLSGILAALEGSQQGNLQALLVEIDERAEAINEAEQVSTSRIMATWNLSTSGLDSATESLEALESVARAQNHTKRLNGVLEAFRNRFEDRLSDQILAKRVREGDASGEPTRDLGDQEPSEQETDEAFLEALFRQRAERDGVF